MTRALWLGSLAVVLLACEAAPGRADVPAPDGTYQPKPWGYGAPPPGWFEQKGHLNPPPQPLPTPDPAPKPDSIAPGPQPPPPQDNPPYRPSTGQPNPPKRTGPFRSCGSGMGVGLAGIGLAWGLLWLGNRFAGRVARRPNDGSAR